MASVDSLAAPPVSSAAPEPFVHADRVSRHSAGRHARPEDAVSALKERIRELDGRLVSLTELRRRDAWQLTELHSQVDRDVRCFSDRLDTLSGAISAGSASVAELEGLERSLSDRFDRLSARTFELEARFEADFQQHELLLREVRAATRRLNASVSDPLRMEGQRSIHRRVKLLEEARDDDSEILDLEARISALSSSLSELRFTVASAQLLEPHLGPFDARIRVLEGRLGIECLDAPIGYPDEPPGFYPQFLCDD